jgi:hypothetical protein
MKSRQRRRIRQWTSEHPQEVAYRIARLFDRLRVGFRDMDKTRADEIIEPRLPSEALAGDLLV